MNDEESKKLNTLSYQVLGVLIREPRSGYDIVKQLESIRPVKTSQVYPTLSRLEKDGLISSEVVPQQGSPDKRINTVTEAGRDVLKSWVGTEPEPAVLRDDFLTMIYSAWTKDPQDVVVMFENRINHLHETMEWLETLLGEHRATYAEEIRDPRDWKFFRNVLLARRISSLQEEVVWSRSVIHMLKESKTDD